MAIDNPYIDDKGGDRILNAKVSPTPNTDYTKYGASANGIFDIIFGRRQPSPLYPKLSSPADEKILVEEWQVIGNQGYTGSCVGWGTANGAIQYQMVKKGTLTKDEWLSPKAAWISSRVRDEWSDNNDTYFALEGTSAKSALDFFRTTGCMLDSWMPNWGDANMSFADAKPIMSKYKISAYFNLGKDQLEWRKWMSAGYPLVVVMKVDQQFYNANSDTGLIERFDTQQGGLHGLHCVSMFGYRKNGRGNNYLLRNSWGTYWGNQGFVSVGDAYAGESFLEVWGVVV